MALGVMSKTVAGRSQVFFWGRLDTPEQETKDLYHITPIQGSLAERSKDPRTTPPRRSMCPLASKTELEPQVLHTLTA